MKKFLKTIIVTAAASLLFVGRAYAEPVSMTLTYDGVKHTYNAESIELRVNGEAISLPLMPPVILNSRTYVPAREVFEPLGAVVDWKDASKELYLAYDGHLIVLKANARGANVNGKDVVMETPAKIINDKLMIPARFVAESLGIPVDWDGNNRVVKIGVLPEQQAAEAQTNVPPTTEPAPAPAPAPTPTQPVASPDNTVAEQAPTGNVVNDVSFGGDGVTDQITIKNSKGAEIKTSRMFSPDRIVLDVADSKNAASFSELGITGRFANKIRISQFEEKTVRIVLDLNDNAVFGITKSGADNILTLSETTYKNIRYAQSPSSITLTGPHGIAAPTITHNDDYLNRKYTLTLPGNFNTYFGSGMFEVNDNIINSFAIQTNNSGNTEIVINEASIFGYIVANEGPNIVIRPVNPKEVHKTIVYLDAGHGGKDPGAAGGGFQEKNLNLNIMLKLYKLLENDPEIKVYASRLEDTYPENVTRAKTANQVADLFVSIHHNSATSSASGTEVLYHNHAGEAYPAISSEAVARIFQTNLVSAMGTKDRGVVKRPNLIVLNTTTIPAVLVEVAFMSNSGDLAKVSTEEGRQRAADAMYKSIKEVFAQYPTGR